MAEKHPHEKHAHSAEDGNRTLMAVTVVAIVGIIIGYAIAAFMAGNAHTTTMSNVTVPPAVSAQVLTPKVEAYLTSNFLRSYGAEAKIVNITNENGIDIIGVSIIQNGTTLSNGEVYTTSDGEFMILGTLYNMSVPVPQNQTAAQTAPATTTKINTQAFESDPTLYPSVGPANATTTVIEFADFQCPYCAMASGLSSQANQYQSQYPDLIGSALKTEQLAATGKVRFIYVSMSFLGQESVNAAEAALCANVQGKFWEMHDAIFAANDMKEDDGKYVNSNLESIAQNITGLNQTEFKGCLENGTELASVNSISQAASAAGVSSTPTFIINGNEVSASWTAINASIQ